MHRTFLTVPMEYSFSESHRGRAIFAFMFISSIHFLRRRGGRVRRAARGARRVGAGRGARGAGADREKEWDEEREGEREWDEELETYTPGPLAIKVSLGLHKTIYQVNGVLGVSASSEKERADLGAGAIWGAFGCPVAPREEEGEGMYL
ncbi:hypothetical protein B0H13DRAFT_2433827 [Mycena leptocephala]|nr:hypothetical protein B0H13DRAFT_2433827 [Mycena leptocephala]